MKKWTQGLILLAVAGALAIVGIIDTIRSNRSDKELAWAFVCGYRYGQIDIMNSGFPAGTFSEGVMKNPDCSEARALAIHRGFTHAQ